MANDQFFVFGSLFDYCAVMCNDLQTMNNCEFYNSRARNNNKLFEFIYRAYNSRIANRIIKLPFKCITYGLLFDKNKIVHGGG